MVRAYVFDAIIHIIRKKIEWESYSEGNCIGAFDFCLLYSSWVAYHLQIRHSIFILLVGKYANMGGPDNETINNIFDQTNKTMTDTSQHARDKHK